MADDVVQCNAKKYYILYVWGCIEPEVCGPYDDEATRDAEARRMNQEDEGRDDVVFAMDVDVLRGVPDVHGYSGGFMEYGDAWTERET